MTKKAQPSSEATPAPADPIATAHAAIVDAEQTAIPAVLRFRDLEYCRTRGVLQGNSPTLGEAESAARHACRALDAARAELVRLERQKVQEDADAQVAATHAEQQRRRDWVASNRPELVKELEAAIEAEATLRAQPFVHDSPSGQHNLSTARARVQRAKVAVEQAAVKAPVPALPAGWATLTAKQQREWVLQADQVAALVVE